MALLAGALLLVAVATRDAGTDGASGGSPATATPTPRPDRLAYPDLGLRLPRPDGWTAQREDDVVRLRSGDDRTALAISVHPRATTARAARRGGERAVRSGYGAVRLLARRRASLGGRPAQAAEMVARGRDRALLDVLVMGARGRWRTYQLVAVMVRPRSEEQLGDLGVILDGVTLERPATSD